MCFCYFVIFFVSILAREKMFFAHFISNHRIQWFAICSWAEPVAREGENTQHNKTKLNKRKRMEKEWNVTNKNYVIKK